MAETNKENVMDFPSVTPDDAVKAATAVLNPNLSGDRALAVATFASAILVRNGLMFAASTIEAYAKNEQERDRIANLPDIPVDG